MTPGISQLLLSLKRIHRLSSVVDLLGWDEQVNLPEGSADFRSEQMAFMSELVHRESTSSEYLKTLMAAEQEILSNQLSPEFRLVVEEARKEFNRETRLPSEFVARKSAAQSRSFHAWAVARRHNSFKDFAPYLKEQLELALEEASYQGYAREIAYDYWIDRFDPGMNREIITPLFHSLVEELTPLVQKIMSSSIKPDLTIFKGFPMDQQDRFARHVVAKLGFDFHRGRLDRSLHPFCSGCGSDTRTTTRFFPDHPLDSLFSSIHETGHGLYEQGLPTEFLGTALGSAAGMAVHESQSRLWENQIARSRPFWAYFEPIYREYFPDQLSEISSSQLFLAINAVEPIAIRVDSDEVTYNLHIVLRYEIETALFSGEISIDQVPDRWNELMRKYLGFTPASDAEGCLQDVHWSTGSFGYFPSYTLGNMLAAQIWSTLSSEIHDIDAQMERGEFMQILQWLRSRIHAKGKQLSASSLAVELTGSPLSHKPLVNYLTRRYSQTYQLTPGSIHPA